MRRTQNRPEAPIVMGHWFKGRSGVARTPASRSRRRSRRAAAPGPAARRSGGAQSRTGGMGGSGGKIGSLAESLENFFTRAAAGDQPTAADRIGGRRLSHGRAFL